MKHKILVGKTKSEIVFVEYELDRNYFSMSGETYDLRPYTYEEVMSSERDCMDDSGMWEDAVNSGATRRSADDFYDSLMGEWDLGDYKYISMNGEEYYFGFCSCGQINGHLKPEDIIVSLLEGADLQFLFDTWGEYHFKNLIDVPLDVIVKMREIYIKYQNDDEDLAFYTLAMRE